MLPSCASNTSKLLVPNNPFQNSPRNRRNCTGISRRKSCINVKLETTHLDPFIISLAAPRAHFQQCRLDKNTKFFTFTRNDEKVVKNSDFGSSAHNTVSTCIGKSLAFAIFYVALAFCGPLGRFYVPPAVAATAVASMTVAGEGKVKKQEWNGHEYSPFTRRLLKSVSGLIKKIEEVRSGENDVDCVAEALEEVKMHKNQLQDELMRGLYAELRILREQKGQLEKRSKELMDDALEANWKEEILKRTAKRDPEEGLNKELEEKMRKIEREYNEIWDRIGEIEDQISRRETMALSIGVRELLFIERECEQLFEAFLREMTQQNVSSYKRPLTKLSRSAVKDELQSAQRQLFEQIVLPNVLEEEDPVVMLDTDSLGFTQRIQQVLQDSREMQRNLETHIRKRMKKYGNEKRFLLNTPVDEVVKGFPEVELKWTFGNKEVVVPKAVRLHLFHGWKKWRENEKKNLKRELIENSELGKKYVAERQERILFDRDRVASKTWYNEGQNRWEMDPISVPYAVSRNLIQSARIRHDWAAMFITIKGDEKEYYVDVKEYDMLFEDFGGFDGLYLRMLARGIPTAVQLMWIPFSELSIRQQVLLVTRICYQCLTRLWNFGIVTYARHWIIKRIRSINEDILALIVFPFVEFAIPYQVRMLLGMAWPEYGDEAVDSWYLKWQSEVEKSFRSKKKRGWVWYFWFLVRSVIYGYVLFHVFRYMKRKVPRLLGYGPFRRNPNLRKLRRVRFYYKYRSRKIKNMLKKGVDPISRAFDQMKRVKNPPIRLKDFASIESMREEINEVVTFLQNPRAFQEMGARAPKGVLIVGERGTGKTSLALAIAAEARVPVVKIKPQQLEGNLWVGQSASNVRELFQTARDLAPVIIFVEDFDLFAGIRGKFIHTKNQDHEAFINQLLVELDGFEKQDGVVLMATTRNLKQIDKGLKRPGRMDRIFHLQPPTQTERERILHIAAKETMDGDLIDLVDWRKVAEKTALLRPVELKLVPMALEGSAFRSKFLDLDELMSYCSWFATFSGFIPNWLRKSKIMKKVSKVLVNHLGLTLSKEDLQNVVNLMEPYGQISGRMELLNPPLDWTRETKFPHAVWAAGRGLIAFLLPNFDTVDNLWLEPFSWEGIGCTKITKASDGSGSENVESRGYLEKKLVFFFGSHIASELLLPFGEENILSLSELKKAQEIATRMVLQYGWGPDDSPTIYHHSNAATALSMGNSYEYEIAAKVEKIYYLAYDKAKIMLLKNRTVLEKIVDELLKYEILTGKDLERIVAENGGIREEEPFLLANASDDKPVFRSFLENGTASGNGTTLITTSN